MQRSAKALHADNLHIHGYDFDALIKTNPALQPYITTNPAGEPSILFANAEAILQLNAALLSHHYGITGWYIPKGYLCPPIPGRVDYLHHVADLVGHDKKIKLLDIGTGANGVYALLAASHFGWRVTASEIDLKAIEHIKKILEANPDIAQRISVKHQPNQQHIFEGIVQPNDVLDVSVCNPPFHASKLEAQISNRRKVNNLSKNRQHTRNRYKTDHNFGGQHNELWCDGGEKQFLSTMMHESQRYGSQCRWFTTLVSKSQLLDDAKKQLKNLDAKQIRVIDMHHGNKITRILAWSFS